jgi:hypothetical protein
MERIVFDQNGDERIIVETNLCNVVVKRTGAVVEVYVITFDSVAEYIGDVNHRVVVREFIDPNQD